MMLNSRLAMFLDHLLRIEQILSKELSETDSTLYARFSCREVIEPLFKNHKFGTYLEVPIALGALSAQVELKHGRDVLALCVRTVFLSVLRRWFDGEGRQQLEDPGQLGIVRRRETMRILGELENPLDYNVNWVLGDDRTQKDMQCFTGRMVPCGAQVVDCFSTVPRSVVLKSGPGVLISGLSYMLNIGGFDRFLEIHTHTPTLSDFNEEGWNTCYLCIAELLQRRPNCRGIVGSSWFYDPVLKDVSPRLMWLQDTPLNSGARLFKVGSFESSKRDALATSATRRRLFDEGKYIPTHYTLVWPRKALLGWARAYINEI